MGARRVDEASEADEILIFRITADAFMRSMVRVLQTATR